MSSLSTFFLVFEFCEHDLAGLLSNVNVKFNLGEIKKVMIVVSLCCHEEGKFELLIQTM